ncbi:hypothetical protein C1645_791725 [Glomus cerebriforme]|uniref:Ion transport domain-containing protein n=1 Tax=Glomus cerebriforme TaxID=658196 RepID=A0A397S362_9GLOM|nr:hypothetical protein C1645_791725 [Glomus cerebriforme]
MNYDYDYFDKLGDPDEEFIDEIKKVLELLYGIKNMDNVKDIDTLMNFIQENLMKKSVPNQLDDEDLKTITTVKPNKRIIYPEIYNESDIEWKNDESIRKLIDYCLKKNEENEHKFMLIVSHLLPILVKESYKNLVDELVTQLTYVKVPSEWFQEENQNYETFLSIREELWGYRFPKHETATICSSIFDRFEKEPRHHVTLCYVPLPGLCTFPDDNNLLFPGGLSPFVKLVMSNDDELLNDKHISTKIFDSPFFHAIIKFKWHIFGRLIHNIVLFVYTTFFILFVTSTTLDFNKHINIFNAIKNYTEEVVIAASKSYIAAITVTIGNIDNVTNSVVNNVTIAEAVKSNIDVITGTIYKATLEAEAKLPHIDIISAINNAAIGAINSKEINDTMITSAIENEVISVINNNYIIEFNKTINGIDAITINEAINSIGGKHLMIVCMILITMGLFIIFRHIIILVKNGFGKQLFSVPSTYVLITAITFIIITGFIELKFLDCSLKILGTFQSISNFLLWICFIGLLCLFKKIGVFAIENTFENYVKSFDNEWAGFISASYDSLDPWKNDYLVIIIKILFSFFTSIIIMNLLIAIINNIYEDVYQHAYTEWSVIRAWVIAYFELAISTPRNDWLSNFIIPHVRRKDKNCFPPTIVYEVSTEKVKEWHNPKIALNSI